MADFISIVSENFASNLGLIFDIIGAIMIFKFGLPKNISRSGNINIVIEEVDENEIIKAKQYDLKAKIGIILLILGFSLQLMGNFL